MDILLHLLNGISMGSVLFLLAAGFALIFGVVGILNLAHGALFALGAYVGWTIAVSLRLDFFLAVVAAGMAATVVGLAMERLFLRHLRGRFDEQVLLTLGIALIIGNAIQWLWGAAPRSPFVAPYLEGSVTLLGISYPVSRVVIIVAAFAIGGALWYVDRRTRIGARVRAGRDDKEMLEALGIDFDRLAMLVFAVGAFLAGAGGVVGAQILGANIELAASILPLAIVVVVVGGLGSVGGAFIGAMLIGSIDVLGRVFFPDLAMFTIFLAMIVILLVRPLGLGGRHLVRT